MSSSSISSSSLSSSSSSSSSSGPELCCSQSINNALLGITSPFCSCYDVLGTKLYYSATGTWNPYSGYGEGWTSVPNDPYGSGKVQIFYDSTYGFWGLWDPRVYISSPPDSFVNGTNGCDGIIFNDYYSYPVGTILADCCEICSSSSSSSSSTSFSSSSSSSSSTSFSSSSSSSPSSSSTSTSSSSSSGPELCCTQSLNNPLPYGGITFPFCSCYKYLGKEMVYTPNKAGNSSGFLGATREGWTVNSQAWVSGDPEIYLDNYGGWALYDPSLGFQLNLDYYNGPYTNGTNGCGGLNFAYYMPYYPYTTSTKVVECCELCSSSSSSSSFSSTSFSSSSSSSTSFSSSSTSSVSSSSSSSSSSGLPLACTQSITTAMGGITSPFCSCYEVDGVKLYYSASGVWTPNYGYFSEGWTSQENDSGGWAKYQIYYDPYGIYGYPGWGLWIPGSSPYSVYYYYVPAAFSSFVNSTDGCDGLAFGGGAITIYADCCELASSSSSSTSPSSSSTSFSSSSLSSSSSSLSSSSSSSSTSAGFERNLYQIVKGGERYPIILGGSRLPIISRP